MIGDEARVVDAFAEYLVEDGWTIDREVDFCDLVARRREETVYVEAKGRTKAIGTDVDTMYGQILRRMPFTDDERVSFPVVVPTRAEQAALRIHKRVLDALRISVFVVDDGGSVRRAARPDD